MMNNSTQQTYVAHCDASVKDGNVVMAAVIVTPNNKLLFRTTMQETYDNTTRAELSALFLLLKHARRYHISSLQVVCDSKSVVEIVNSGRGFNGRNATSLNRTLRKLRKTLSEFDEVVIFHRKRDHNVYADSLCRMRRQRIVFKKNGGRVNLREAAPVE